MAEGRRSLYLAGMKETEGERIVKAIQKLADKIRKLENERQQSKVKVESLTVQEISSTKASIFFQRLAKAEARCKALQQQLAHIRKMVRDTSSVIVDGNSTSKSGESDNTSTFDSLPSVTSMLQTPDDHVHPQKNKIALNSRSIDTRNKVSSPFRSQFHQPQISEIAPTDFSSNILEVPVYKHFKHSFSNTRHKQDILPTHDYSENEAQNLSKDTHKLKTRPNDRQNGSDSKMEMFLNTCTSDSSSLISMYEAPLRTGRSRKKRRSFSQARSSSGTPLGQFLPSSRSQLDLVSHYHVKMNEIPFCSATTAGKSHSLGANLQNLMSMVKVCHPSLCNAAPLHRRRSRSADRQPPLHHADYHTIRRNMTRWNSASALDGLDSRPRRMPRSRSLERTPLRKSSPRVHSDLDLIPIKLKPTKDKNAALKSKEKCETPGNVCIKTEIKPLPVGSNKVVEVKMTTSTKPKAEKFHRGDTVTKRRELLKDVQELQYMVESDQCC